MNLLCDARLRDRDFDVRLEVGAGETLALLGPNGAGKSTLIELVAGLLRPDDGVVRLGDRDLARVEDGRVRSWEPPHARRVGLLAQQPLLFPHLDAAQNIAFGPRSLGMSRRQAATVARDWLTAVGLAGLGDRRPGQLSGGQAQRVAVARALAADPSLVLLDEPLAALDVDVAPALRHLLKEVLLDRTAVIATHDVLDALLLADRVAVIEAGRVVEQGPVAEVLTRPRSAFAARVAGLNLVAGIARDGAVAGADGRLTHGQVVGEPLVEGAAALAVYRPHAVSVFSSEVAGSPRNSFDVTISSVEPVGGLIRVRADALSADITPQAASDLHLGPGARVWFSVKATEVSLYRA